MLVHLMETIQHRLKILRANRDPVSYTHLDVYKRQRPYCAVKTKKTRSSAFFSAETVRAIDQARHKPLETPVSYTHLDVYKRQQL